MKIKFNREELQSAVNIVSKAVSVKSTMPILECILIKASSEEIRFTANNLELGIETVVKCDKCKVQEPGKTAIEARLFADIVSKITENPDGDIIFTSDGNIVEMTSMSASYKIQEKDPDQFPELPMLNEDNYIAISQFTLKEIIKDTIFSIAVNDSNKMMTGELFEVNGNILKAVTLDGHRISIRNTELKEDYGSFKAVIPGRTLTEISKILSGEADREVLIFFEKESVMFRFDNTVMVSRLIDGEYFRIDNMLSSDYDTKLVVNRKEFLSNVERSTILIRESDKKPLVLNIRDQNMNMKLNSVLGSLNSDMMVNKTGNDLMIGFNPKFILDVLRVVDDEEISIYMTNSKAPCFIRDDAQSYIYLILPINFNTAAY
ncbi:MAG: DNA polymerase III subunit beta [Clostridiales bacterium]|nr:DNA polymerase III subunit beta [Clostridiales bacterium]